MTPRNRRFITVDYEAALDLIVSLRECLAPDHLARFIVDVIAHLDLNCIYVSYGIRGGKAYAPEILLGLLFYGYATGVFSSRKIEKATYESIPFRYIAGGLHPDHDTIAHFRKTFLPEIRELFVQTLLLAHTAGVLKLGHISLDGSKIHADASKSKAVSYKRLLDLETQLRQEVEELLALGEQADQVELPEGLVIEDEIAFRKNRLANLAEAKAVLEARAQERYEAELAEYEAACAGRKSPADGPQTMGAYPATSPSRATRQGPVQLYRPRVAHYEKQQQSRRRPTLQYAGRRGSGQFLDCSQHALQPPQRLC